MLANDRNGTLYMGVTTDLIQRVWQHKNKFVDGFTKKYNIDKLVWYEQHLSIQAAMLREKQMKRWERAWKIQAIEKRNPYWNDLYLELVG
jgi:putative endonuclease